MKTQSFLLTAVMVAAALAGCADNGGNDHETNTTMTPATMTPATTTPVVATPTVPTTPSMNETPNCPPTAPSLNATGTRIGLPELQFTVKEATASDPCYGFVGPATATAGWTVVSLAHPAGTEFHIMPMFYIGNHTPAEFAGAMVPPASGGAPMPPDWAVPSGGVGGVTPHSSGAVAMDLKVGNYVYFCPINGHHMRGMSGSLAVTPSTAARAEPTSPTLIKLEDYRFSFPANISASTTILKVYNNGTEPHESPLVQLAPGANMTTFLATLEDPNTTGPPPGALIGGANVLAPAQEIYILVDLDAGTRYGMVCFVESPTHNGAPHVALGMVGEFVAV